MSERFVVVKVLGQDLESYLNGKCLTSWHPEHRSAKVFRARPLGAQLVYLGQEGFDLHNRPNYRIVWCVPIRRRNIPIEPPPPEPSKSSGFWQLLLFTAAGAFFVFALLDSLSRPWNYYAVYILLALSVVMWCWIVSRRGGSNAQHQSRPQRP